MKYLFARAVITVCNYLSSVIGIRRTLKLRFGLILIAFTSVGAVFTTTHIAFSDQPSSWHIVSSPNSPAQNSINSLSSVSATSDTNAWVVGFYYTDSNSSHQLIEHWNGTQWIYDSFQGTADPYSVLLGVSALSPNDVWAVGYSGTTDNQYAYGSHPLVEHYLNGVWSIVNTPLINGFLTAITAVSPNDVWTVGYNIDTDGELIEHWDGSNWSIVPPPTRTPGAILNSITALSANNIWAVGTSNKFGRNGHAIADYWNGSSWVTNDPPIQTTGTGTNFNNVAAQPTTGTVWASGIIYKEDFTSSPLVANFINNAWAFVTVSPPSQCLSAISAACSYRVAATANEVDLIPEDLDINTLAQRLINGNWQTVPIEIPTLGLFPGGHLWGVTSVPGSNSFWAVGQSNGGTTLIEHYTGGPEICNNNGNLCIQVRVDPVLGCVKDDGTSFSPDFWNDEFSNHGLTQDYNNCYAYATNKATGTYAQPGRGAGMSITSLADVTCVGIETRAKADGLSPLGSGPAGCDPSCPGNSRKIALVVDPGKDYHWYRQDSDGTWSHKPAIFPATNSDASMQTITDPRTANRDYRFTPIKLNYSVFCTCFCTRSACDETIQ